MAKQALRVSDAKCILALAVGLMLHLGAATAGVSRDSFVIPQGDAVRGESIVTSRQLGLCLLCHSAPAGDPRVQGNLAPNLAGAGSRWSKAQLRERIANARAINPESIMPSYASTEGLNRVAQAWVGQPLLNAQQIEDVVAYLETLRE